MNKISMKLTDYVADYLAALKVRHAFVLQGGAALHLIDSIARHDGIEEIAMQHEQSSAMAADSYAKTTKNIGVTISTSGPGATNLLTGIACSYFDSVPTLHITGNVASFRQSDDLGVRQYGFQETDIVSMAKPITKYAVQIKNPQDIVEQLPKAIAIAKSGRPGPVLIDIPDDFQREEVVFPFPHKVEMSREVEFPINQEQFILFQNMLSEANRPIFIFGAGLLNDEQVEKALLLAEKLNVPYLTTWPLKGLQDHSEKLNLGSFGTHSYRGNNFVLQNADLVLSIGCRLDSRATAKLDTFARDAKICMVDVDKGELNKFTTLHKAIDLPINLTCRQFLNEANSLSYKVSDYKDWWSYISKVREKLNFEPEYDQTGINPYFAIEHLFSIMQEDDITTIDTGTCLPLTLVYGKEKKGQKFISSYNNTPMGYALPAAIGAALASGNSVYCVAGDGGLQMNVQELATIKRFDLPIKIVVFNNAGHCMIKQTQDDWLDSNYYASDELNGLPNLQFNKIASAYGLEAIRCDCNDSLKESFSSFDTKKQCLIELVVNSGFRYEPIIKYGNPLENMSPLLSSELIEEHMLIGKNR